MEHMLHDVILLKSAAYTVYPTLSMTTLWNKRVSCAWWHIGFGYSDTPAHTDCVTAAAGLSIPTPVSSRSVPHEWRRSMFPCARVPYEWRHSMFPRDYLRGSLSLITRRSARGFCCTGSNTNIKALRDQQQNDRPFKWRRVTTGHSWQDVRKHWIRAACMNTNTM